jgi:hypothetical protein
VGAGHAGRETVRRLRPAWACLAVLLLVGGVARADEAGRYRLYDPDRPEILNVAVVGRLAVDRAGQARVTYRALRANVAAVVQVAEDLDGARRVTSQREVGVVAVAFGREEGDLVLSIVFATPGRKRLTFTLLTDEREESEPASVEVDVAP